MPPRTITIAICFALTLAGCVTFERNLIPDQLFELMAFLATTQQYQEAHGDWPDTVHELHVFAVEHRTRFTYHFDDTLRFESIGEGQAKLLMQLDDGTWHAIYDLNPDGSMDPIGDAAPNQSLLLPGRLPAQSIP